MLWNAKHRLLLSTKPCFVMPHSADFPFPLSEKCKGYRLMQKLDGAAHSHIQIRNNMNASADLSDLARVQSQMNCIHYQTVLC